MKIKKLIACTALAALALAVALCGCVKSAAAESENKRMTLVYSSGEMLIFQDMNTGVQYLVYSGYKQGGICPLFDADGSLYVED